MLMKCPRVLNIIVFVSGLKLFFYFCFLRLSNKNIYSNFMHFLIYILDELEPYFANMEPKLIFCQTDKVEILKTTLGNINLKTTIVTFDKGNEFDSLSEFMMKNGDESTIKNFQ